MSRLAISNKMLPNGAECVVVSGTITVIPEAPLIEAEELNVNLLCKAFLPDSSENYVYPRCVGGLMFDGFVLMDVRSCPRNLSREVAGNAKSCSVPSPIPLEYLWIF